MYLQLQLVSTVHTLFLFLSFNRFFESNEFSLNDLLFDVVFIWFQLDGIDLGFHFEEPPRPDAATTDREKENCITG